MRTGKLLTVRIWFSSLISCASVLHDIRYTNVEFMVMAHYEKYPIPVIIFVSHASQSCNKVRDGVYIMQPLVSLIFHNVLIFQFAL